MIASRKGLKPALAILMGFMLAMLVDAGAHALPDDSPGTEASVTTKTVQAGQQVSFTATGFPAGATVYVQLDDGATHWDSSLPGRSILHKKVPSSGKVSGSVVLPANVALGAHWLRFNATTADPNGGPQQITCRGDSDFTVVAAQGQGEGGGQPGGNGGGNQGNGQNSNQGNGQGGNQGNGQGGNNGGGQQPGGGAQQQGQPGGQQGVAVDAQGRPLPPGAAPSATSTVKIGGQIMTIAPEAASPVPTERPKNTAKKTPVMPSSAPKAAAEEESGGPNMGVVGGMALVFIGLITATLITNRAKAIAAGSSRGEASGSSPYGPALAAAGPQALDGSDTDAAGASGAAGGGALAADGSAAAFDDPDADESASVLDGSAPDWPPLAPDASESVSDSGPAALGGRDSDGQDWRDVASSDADGAVADGDLASAPDPDATDSEDSAFDGDIEDSADDGS